MLLLDKLIELENDRVKFQEENYFISNSKDTFTISKDRVKKGLAHLNFEPISEEEVKQLGRKWRVNCDRIFNLYSFLSTSKYLIKDDNFAISMISTTLYKYIKDENGKQVFCNPTHVKRVLDDMQKLGMLYCVDRSYSNSSLALARKYILSTNRIKSLFSLPSLNSIRYGKIIYNNNENNFNNINNDINDIINNNNDNNMNTNFDEKIKDLYNKLNLYKEIDKANKGLKSVYRYKATGWRPSAGICYIASKEKVDKHKTQHLTYREDVIKSDFGDLHEWDRNASIYNLMVYLGKGEVRSNDRGKYDLYDHFKRGLQTLRSVTNSSCTNDLASTCNARGLSVNWDYTVNRDDVKNLLMTINFADFRQIRSLLEDTLTYLMNGDSRCKSRAMKFSPRFVSICKFGGFTNENLINDSSYTKIYERVINWLKAAKKLLQDFVGDFKIGDKSIFLYEAKVNLHCQNLLREKGFDCVSVYDGFYTNADENTWWDCYLESLKLLKALIK